MSGTATPDALVPAAPSPIGTSPEIVIAGTPRWRDIESARLAAGLPVPLWHRAAWQDEVLDGSAVLVCAPEPDGSLPVTAAAVSLDRSRALPGFRIARSERLGTHVPAHRVPALAAALARAAHVLPRVLRLHVEVMTHQPSVAQAWSASLAASGFRRLPIPRNYSWSLVLDLSSPAEQLFATLDRGSRRNVRAPERLPVSVQAISDVTLVPRINELMRESLGRTGATYVPLPWARILAHAAQHPEQSRVVGLFDTTREGPEALLGLAWAGHHGDHAHYDAGASTRSTPLKVGIAYPLIWDLILWAHTNGARWFDFGGVSRPAEPTADALAGISAFKRSFTKELVEVGQEWVYEPRPLVAAMAGRTRDAARWVRDRLQPSRPTAGPRPLLD